MSPIAQRVLTAIVTSVVFCSLTILAFRWWPAWVIMAALYAGVLLYYRHLVRLTRKDREREESRR